MQVVHPRCCGLDVHKRSVVACVLSPNGRQTRTFGTTTAQVLELADWLVSEGVTHVAMESTGVYWRPIYNVLECTELSLLVVNAHHIKAVPGRKTDVKDAEWIADLLQHGLLRASFIPDRPQRELRELTRYRVSLVRERAAEANRIQKTLEGANIKLASVASDILGLSGRHMLEALVAGRMTPAEMAQLARGRLKEKIPQLERALVGRFGAHQRFLLARQLAHRDDLEELLAEVGAEIQRRLEELGSPESNPPPSPGSGETPTVRITLAGAVGAWEAVVQRLQTIPGVGQRTAEALV